MCAAVKRILKRWLRGLGIIQEASGTWKRILPIFKKPNKTGHNFHASGDTVKQNASYARFYWVS
jgi:hypothetical protein